MCSRRESRSYGRLQAWAQTNRPGYRIFDTICDSTSKRQAEVEELAQNVDAIVVVGGKSSGNTQRLAEIARQAGKPAFHIETETDLDLKALAETRSIGITAGASTPNWVIKRVYRTLESLPYRSGRIWHGTKRGLDCWDGQNWTAVEAFAEQDVIAAAVEPNGRLWFGAAESVFSFDGDTWVTYGEKDGLAPGSVDLIWIDPPLNNDRDQQVFWGETRETRAFQDRQDSKQAYIGNTGTRSCNT